METIPPIETFPALDALPDCRHGFVGRIPGVDVDTDRADALARLDASHRRARQSLIPGRTTFITAEQVHGNALAILTTDDPLPAAAFPGVDGLITNRPDVMLGIYVADCCAVYLVDPARRVIGLVHAGKKGTALGIVPAALAAMTKRFGTPPGEVTAQLGPCIRPPWYEVDFAAQIIAQCRDAGVTRIADSGANTAADPLRYYSYRREQGRTGRMLALLALA